MLPSRIVICLLLPFLVLAGCSRKQTMTPERFQKIVDSPGDNLPLPAALTNGSPHWSNSVADVVNTYANGQVTSEEIPVACKTIGGKYVVYTLKSEVFGEAFHCLLAYDEKSRVLKNYAFSSNELAEADIDYDAKAKTYTQKSSYGDGVEDVITGHWSDTEIVEQEKIYQHGALVITRDITNRPVSVSQ